MPDRESFVAAIAAAPEDDLPRLVFADYLDEHGEPERAEFIRLQIGARHAEGYDQRQAMEGRAQELFEAHWQVWAEPFLTALNPECDPAADMRVHRRENLTITTTLNSVDRPDVASRVGRVRYRRGFVENIFVTLTGGPVALDTAAAFRHEPVTQVNTFLDEDPRGWASLSDPALRRVRELSLAQFTNRSDAVPLTGAAPAFNDPHLAGVRRVALNASAPERPEWVIHARSVAEFERSPLGYRADAISLRRIDRGGLRVLTRSTRLHPRELHLGLSGDAREHLGLALATARFAPDVRKLRVYPEMDDRGLATLCQSDRWHSLTELGLNYNRITDAGLHALAGASFTPYLEVLRLYGNPLTNGDGNLDGLRELAAALDPHQVKHFDLMGTGLTAVPDFLEERFGDRVLV